jgi:ubiquinone/menaquinone biosynthesis C-methylase UbiE
MVPTTTTTTTTTRAASSIKTSTTKRRTSTGSSSASSSSRFIARATNATDAGGKVKPDWAGEENFLSKVVDAAISNELLYEKIMKPMARRTLINTAEKNGIAWRDEAARLEANKDVYDAYESIKREEVEYPEYYLKPFHAYAEGNLCWLAAFEAESATYSMALRVWPKDRITAETAQRRLRDSYTNTLREHREKHNAPADVEPKKILDVGCSVGMSTRYISDAFPSADVIGMDLSPYMLAVASARDAGVAGSERRSWVHGKGEDTKYPDESLDVVSLAFVIHECPEYATLALMKEAMRILKPGGTFIMTDNNPQSPVIQNLPPALFTLMKSTEPHSNEYYSIDIQRMLRDVGFDHVHQEQTDPRHRTVCATKK